MNRRRDDPDDADVISLRNGWFRRVREAAELLNKPGIVAVAMLGVFVGWTSGWITSPLTSMARDLQDHKADVTKLIELRTREQVELVTALGALTKEMRRQNVRAQMRECGEIRDPEIRRRCLE